jgi:hypothetical protein
VKILSGKPIALDGDSSYEDDVSKVITRIASYQTGRAILELIRKHGYVVVSPYLGGDFNAETLGNAEFAGFSGRRAIIHFTPSIFETYLVFNGVKIPNVRALIYTGMQTDTNLLHEMVHAARVLSGDFNMATLKDAAMKTYENEEDFFAIMVGNIYLSEQGKNHAALRNSHLLVTTSLTDAELGSQVFLFENKNFELIAKFCRQHPNISKMIAAAHAAFNPVREYLQLPDDLQFDLKTTEDISVSYRVVAYETMPLLSDDYLLGLLKPRFQANDVAGFGGRAAKLAQAFRTISLAQAPTLFTRLVKRASGDQVARYFHDHLSTATRIALLQILAHRTVGAH